MNNNFFSPNPNEKHFILQNTALLSCCTCRSSNPTSIVLWVHFSATPAKNTWGAHSSRDKEGHVSESKLTLDVIQAFCST